MRLELAALIATCAFAGGAGAQSAIGNITTLPGTSSSPAGLAVAPDGALFYADFKNIYRLAPGAQVPTFVTSMADSVMSLALDFSGNLFIGTYPGRVHRRTPAGDMQVVVGAGTNGFGGDGGPALTANINFPVALTFDAPGNLYISDYGNHRIRRVDANGIITTFAGVSPASYGLGDGRPATEAGIAPRQAAFDALGNLLMATYHQRIRKVDTAGFISTFAGNGQPTWTGDGGPAAQAGMHFLEGLALDPSGNVYFSDHQLHVVRRVRPDGIVEHVAGTGTLGDAGDGGPARQAHVSHPGQLAWDPRGYLIIGGSRMRAVQIFDDTPDPIAFEPQLAVAANQVIQSNTITPADYAFPAAVSIVGGEYSIGCNGTFTAAAGTLSPGQSVCVRATSADVGNKDKSAALTVGGQRAVFLTRTVPGPGTISISPSSVDFAPYSMFMTTPARQVTLTNTSQSTVYVNDVRPTPGYSVTHVCGVMAPGASCVVSVVATPALQGTAGGSITFQSSPGDQVVSLTATGERSFITHYYHSILRRAPDAQGLAYWSARPAAMTGLGLNWREAWFAMAMGFFFSPEYAGFARSDGAFLEDIYRTFFNRAPDPGGLSYWSTQLAQGMPREVALAAFMFSIEFRNFAQLLDGNTSDPAPAEAMVADFYRGLLARLPDADGFNHWVGRFRAAMCASPPSSDARRLAIYAEVEAISSQFTLGSEYQARTRSNGQFVGDLYNAFLRRGGDLAGVQSWIAQLDDGSRTREDLRRSFMVSQEFDFNRIWQLVGSSCPQ